MLIPTYTRNLNALITKFKSLLFLEDFFIDNLLQINYNINMKIDSCLIIKNEEENIGNLIDKLLKFSDEIHLTDTGSTDNTIKIIEKKQKKYKNIFLDHFEWCYDFSKARNFSMKNHKTNSDFYFWCDGDEEPNDKMIETLLKFKEEKEVPSDVYYIRIDSGYRAALIRANTDFNWTDPVHEFISFSQSFTEDYDYFNNGSIYIHYQKNTEEHYKRNLNIFLNLEKQGYKFSVRNRYYYGRELMLEDYKELAACQFKKCITSELNTFQPEFEYTDKINSCVKLCILQDSECVKYFLKLLEQGILRRDMFFFLGNYYYTKGNNELAEFYYKSCVVSEYPSPNLVFEYNDNCVCLSYINLGSIYCEKENYDVAYIYYNKALEIEPENELAKEAISLLQKN